MRTLPALLLLVTACSGADQRPELSAFDGDWGLSVMCVAEQQRCDVPSWLTLADASIDLAVVSWKNDGAVLATHRGDVADGCLAVPSGRDDDIPRNAYRLCPVNGEDVLTIGGTITWASASAGPCDCAARLRLQP